MGEKDKIPCTMHLKLKWMHLEQLEQKKGNNMIAEALGEIAKQIGAVATSSRNLRLNFFGSEN